jgi:hypothetical protein
LLKGRFEGFPIFAFDYFEFLSLPTVDGTTMTSALPASLIATFCINRIEIDGVVGGLKSGMGCGGSSYRIATVGGDGDHAVAM